MTETSVRPAAPPVWPPLTVGLLTVVWVFGLFVTAVRWMGAAWLAGSSDAAQDRPGLLAGQFAAVLIGGPVILTIIAIAGKLRKTALTYGVLAGLGVVLVLLAMAASREPSAPAPQPTHCVELSGGDTRCPGG
jgi:xanthine/uracil permease